MVEALRKIEPIDMLYEVLQSPTTHGVRVEGIEFIKEMIKIGAGERIARVHMTPLAAIELAREAKLYKDFYLTCDAISKGIKVGIPEGQMKRLSMRLDEIQRGIAALYEQRPGDPITIVR